MAKVTTEFPQQLYVYAEDIDGTTIYNAFLTPDEIGDDQNGKLVATYSFVREQTLTIKRELT